MPDAVCPGCGHPTDMFDLPRDNGAARHSETRPSWCRPCLDQKVIDARTGLCHCAQHTDPHIHHPDRTVTPAPEENVA